MSTNQTATVRSNQEAINHFHFILAHMGGAANRKDVFVRMVFLAMENSYFKESYCEQLSDELFVIYDQLSIIEAEEHRVLKQ